MSLTRSLLNEFRPFFQALDDPTWSRDPYIVAPRAGSGAQDRNQAQSLSPITRTPHVHMSDEADKYVVEAEVPGVRKENLDVTIGDNGRSLTISANVVASGSTGQSPQATPVGEAPQEQQQQQASASTTDVAGTQSQQKQSSWASRYSFSRTIWLPRPVDSSKVAAKLDHGILTLEIPKLQAKTQKIDIA